MNIKLIRYNLMLIYGLMLWDFLLTWLGVNVLNCIYEANILMKSLFNYGFGTAFTIRIISCIIPLLALWQLRKYNITMCVLWIILLLEFAVIGTHINWLIKLRI